MTTILLYPNVALSDYSYSRSIVDGWGLTAACSLIVILGTLANLASVASSIVVYKDWIVIIAVCDSQTLASKFELSSKHSSN